MKRFKSKVRFRFRFQRRSDLVTLFSLMVIVAVFLGFLAWEHEEAEASVPNSPRVVSLGARRYYLTKGIALGNQAKTACATGYHMASLFEIVDPSHLQYDPQLGESQDDSGGGPPSQEVAGWVRTGNTSYGIGVNVPGQSNCSNWTNGTSSYYGSLAKLPAIWEDNPNADVNIWDVGATLCNSPLRVWCVSDVVGYRAYLAIVMK